jgi:uncharacterized protein YutE (UPF0331/DUF86 family)
VVDRDLILRKLADLVHEYARVEAEIVVRILRQHLDDLARFGTTARAWV